MNIYEVQPIFSHPPHPFELTIDAPGSKSITNRALMLAALANGETLLKGALFSDDSRHFLQCLKDLGFDVVVDEPAPDFGAGSADTDTVSLRPDNQTA